MTAPRIQRVRSATIKYELSVPIHFGEWVMRHREFLLVRIDSTDGQVGYAYCLTRDAPLQAIIARTIAPCYVDQPVDRPEEVFYRALYTNHAVHAAGVGMRALSVVDIAAWDLAARVAAQPLVNYLGGEAAALPATAIVGYPPNISAAETHEQVAELVQSGWRRFKLPIAPTVHESVARLAAAREAAPHAWIGFDANMVFRSAEEVAAFDEEVAGLDLGWLEDVVPPGNAAMVAKARRLCRAPIAMGDEQGGSYHPEALLASEAIDVLRVDATTNGGITRLREIVPAAARAGVQIAPHMFPHVHSRILNGLGVTAPIEWGCPGTGVHPMDDALEQPTLDESGAMSPLRQSPGVGDLVNLEWIASQGVADPERLLRT